jgi:hypothetical protein
MEKALGGERKRQGKRERGVSVFPPFARPQASSPPPSRFPLPPSLPPSPPARESNPTLLARAPAFSAMDGGSSSLPLSPPGHVYIRRPVPPPGPASPHKVHFFRPAASIPIFTARVTDPRAAPKPPMPPPTAAQVPSQLPQAAMEQLPRPPSADGAMRPPRPPQLSSSAGAMLPPPAPQAASKEQQEATPSVSR